MVNIMVKLNAWIDEIPPLVQRSRFGNKAFRIWFDRLCEVCHLMFLDDSFSIRLNLLSRLSDQKT